MIPLRSRHVTVQIALVGELPALVESEDDTTIVLALAVHPPAGIDRAVERGKVRIQCISPRGIQHVLGTGAWSPASPTELRIEREAHDVIQRRDTVRVPAVMAATLSKLGGTPRSAETTTLNVSSTGVLVRDPLGLELGARVRVLIAMEDGEPLAVDGHVVRELGSEKGIHIDTISRSDQTRLSRLIAERQRAELRIARSA
jgi:hypothetical protein